MSVQSEIERIQNNVANTYNVLEEAGADMPQSRNTNNLAETAASIKAVLYGKTQSLTEAQKSQARQNIGVLEPLIGSTSNITPSQVSEALLEGRDVVLSYTDKTYGVIHFSGFMEVPALGVVVSSGVLYYYGAKYFELYGDKSDGTWSFSYDSLATIADIPSAPVRGVDYWTEADQESIVQQVIAALGTPVFGRVDAENNIILTGELADGTYTLKYEGADGSQTEIGEIVVGAVQIINQIPISTDGSGNIYGEDYNGDGVNDGYKVDTRVSGGNEQGASGVTTTGYIPANEGDIFYFKNMTLLKSSSNKYACRFSMFDVLGSSNQNNVEGADVAGQSTHAEYFTYDASGNVTSFRVPTGWFKGSGTTVQYIRIGAGYIGADSIVSRNIPIE